VEAVRYGWADVLRVDPVYETVAADIAEGDEASARQDCPDEPPPHDNDQANTRGVGTTIGALIGGVIGHAFGRDDEDKTAAAASAATGEGAGNRIAATQDQATNPTMQQTDDAERDAVAASLLDCRRNPSRRASPPPERRITGYDIEYRYKGEIYMTRLPFDPGDRVRVKIMVVPVE
jgi:uncharacterized protein YcfJ